DNTINFIPENGFDGTVTFAYSVTDKDGDSDNAQVTVIVLPDGVENHVPVAEDINVNTTVNTPVDIDILSHVQGLDDGFGYLVIHELPYIGNAVVNDNRTVTYTPANLFVGQVTFVYRVADAHGDWDTGVITVDVTEQPNSTPVANDLSVATSFNTPVDIDVLHNDTGLDDVPITVTINYPPNADHGTAVVNDDNTVTFTPAQDYIGGTFFQYTVTDADGDADFATVNVVVKSGENFVPVANNDEATTYLNTPVQIDVLANDSGLEDGFGDLIIQQNPQFGDVVVNDDYTVTFTPANYFLGQIDFTYKLSDLDGDYDFGNVTVLVTDEYNPIPVAYNDSIGTSFNEPVNIDVLANDTNLDDTPITVTIFEHPSIFEGEASVNADNSITFTPNQDFSGPVNFRYLVTDANGDSDNANVKVTVKDGVNNIPVANDDRRGTSFETPVTVDVTTNDTGLEDQPILVTISSEPTSTEGVAAVNDDNTVTFTPESNFVGVVEFIYRVIDADGDWDEATVTISVKSGENMVPDANDLNAVTHINLQTTINVLENDTGIDDEPLSLIITEYPSVEEGTVEINDDNTVNFIPYQDFLGATKFTYKIIDNDGDFDTAEVSVSVIHEIIANNDEVELERGETITVNVLENDHGLTGIDPTVGIYEQPNHGVVTVDSDYNLIYTAPDDYVGQDVLTYQVCSQYGGCSQANVNIEIINVGIEIPEGFSPDGDGINDFFEIIGLEYYDQVKVKIYNRWGNLVYQSMDYKNDWDGTANSSLSVGRTLPNGTYYYIIEIVDTDDRINGNVFLKR
ncbi:MAG: Ig-like domain-containing protein, partial [Perlabentimonas sp.]